MQVIFIFFIITSITGSIRMQNWLGTYTTDSMCNTTICCYPTGQILFTNYSENMIGILSNRSGQCGNETALFVIIRYPNNYTSSFTIDITLDSNSQSIAFVDTINSACMFKI